MPTNPVQLSKIQKEKEKRRFAAALLELDQRVLFFFLDVFHLLLNMDQLGNPTPWQKEQNKYSNSQQ